MIEILVFTLALACFLKGRPAASPAGAYFWLFPAAVAALGCLQLATVAAPDGPRPFVPFTAAPDETRAAVMLWAACAAVLWSVPRIVVTHSIARRYARFLLGVGLALAVLGLLQEVTGGQFYWLRQELRFGSYYNRDHAANIMLVSLAAGVGLFFSRPGKLLAGALVVVVIGLALCTSEASLMAIPLAASAVSFIGADFARSPRRRRLRAAAALAGAVLTIFFAYFHVAASADAGALVAKNVMGRLSIYGDAWRWWRDAPLFGTGLGGFETIYPSYQDLTLLGTAAHAHSDWIEFALETGIFGLIGAFIAAGLAVLISARTWREARSSEMRALIGGSLAATAVFAAHSLFDFSFQIPANAVFFFGVLGFLLSAPSWADKSVVRAPELRPSAGAALLAAAYCIVMLRVAVLPALAARRAATPGEPLERVVAIAGALSLDDRPDIAVLMSVAAYKAAGDGPAADYAMLRLSLRYALAAVERRPFNTEILYLAGAILRRLGRSADGADFATRAVAVRFARLEPRRENASEQRRKALEELRSFYRSSPAQEKE
ncbi:MAG: O-antigen ligase family protein [Elusimicrobia bacterium]|nr:O-antigen ligase family protein [Elusimicrobiota bacterium]